MTQRRPVVVVAEDEPDARDLLAIVIGRAGYEVVVAEDGLALVSAVDALRARDVDPFAIVTDIDMPGQSGLEAARELVDRGITVPTVFATGEQDRELLAQAQSLGADVLVKPIDPAQLRNVLSRLSADASAATSQ